MEPRIIVGRPSRVHPGELEPLGFRHAPAGAGARVRGAMAGHALVGDGSGGTVTPLCGAGRHR